ncbi:MAG: cation transporter, partial [Oligoflexales bacterium]|nr:cation transporter [Oligoflexales bacterium]
MNHCSHSHHDHHSSHGPRPLFGGSREGRLIASVAINLLITIVQVAGGFLSGSLALMSDALHNLSDTISLGISFIAVRLTKRIETEERTFGYQRAEIIAAFLNSAVLIGIAAMLFFEAVRR